MLVPVRHVAGARPFDARVRFRGESALVELRGLAIHAAVDGRGRIVGSCVPAQRLTVTRVRRLPTAAYAARPVYDAPPGAPYTAEEVRSPRATAQCSPAR